MSETNNNFRDLKRLLKLKQHEVPPPGYFSHFSGEVMSRIRAGEHQETLADRLGSGSLLTYLLQVFQAKPGVVGGFATSLCLLLLIGVVMADRSEPGATGGITSTQSENGTATLASVPLAPPDENSGIAVSSNSVVSLQPVATLFGSQENPLFQPAAFVPSQQQ
jgi:hypothetical protein